MKETDEEWLERLQKEVVELRASIEETSRKMQEYLDSPQHQEYLRVKKEFDEWYQSLHRRVIKHDL